MISDKKGMTLGTLVQLIIAASLILIFVGLIIKFVSGPETQTESSFKTLGAEIKIMIKDLETTDKAEVTVPIFIDKEYAIRAISKGASSVYPSQCKDKSCLVLSTKEDLNKITSVMRFDNIEFATSDPLKSAEGSIVKVKLSGEKKDSKITLTLQQIQVQ